MWFSGLYSVFKHFLNESQREAVRVYGSSSSQMKKAIAELHKYVDPANLPPEYGGSSGPIGQAVEEKVLQELVDRVLKEKGMVACKDDTPSKTKYRDFMDE